jgi:hypothetical protein
MDNSLKSLENNALAALSARAPATIVNAIKTASAKTGVSFTYLMEKAAAESNFNPTVKAKTSSATGLFQFIESTWMDMVNRHGDKYGIDTSQSRKDLLNLRKDPSIASFMAAEFASDNANYLKQTVGNDVGNTELYFAHFMGAGGASAFLSQHKKNPLSIGADLFPAAARANKNVFYDSKTGQPKTLEQIYQFFDKKFSNETTVTTDNTNIESYARKPKNNSNSLAGYQHIPFSLKNPIQILQARGDNYTGNNSSSNIELAENVKNSLYKIENNVNAFFSKPAMPASFYGNLATPTSLFLGALKVND